MTKIYFNKSNISFIHFLTFLIRNVLLTLNSGLRNLMIGRVNIYKYILYNNNNNNGRDNLQKLNRIVTHINNPPKITQERKLQKYFEYYKYYNKIKTIYFSFNAVF